MADGICRKYRREGRLFELARITGLDCPSFIKSFMNSKTADAKTMSECWLGFHTFDVTMAIDDLKEIYKEKCMVGETEQSTGSPTI